MKQTAVEWLENEMQKTYIFNQNDFDMFKQAKEMEKQQIIDAYNSGQQKEAKTEFWTKGTRYYNEKYKQDETN